MEGYGPASYGDAFADVYDEWYPSDADVEAAVDRLAGWAAAAGGGALLELGSGTGRLALPLAGRGLEVWGVEASPAMVDRLRTKPGAERVRMVVGDMASVELPSDAPRFALVVAAGNTFFGLTSAGAQRRCLDRITGWLAPTGRLVLEAFVPDDSENAAGSGVEARRVEVDRVVLSVSRRRPGDTVVDGQHVEITGAGIRMRPWCIRYAAPDELDRMAAAAGLALAERHGGWREEPFTEDSRLHISVYALATFRV